MRACVRACICEHKLMYIVVVPCEALSICQGPPKYAEIDWNIGSKDKRTSLIFLFHRLPFLSTSVQLPLTSLSLHNPLTPPSNPQPNFQQKLGAIL